MARYIDADALKAYVSNKSTHWLNEWDTAGVLAAIDKQPTIEARPVVRGEWIIDKERCTATCSKCGKILRFSDEMQIVFLREEERFCYYCAADMRPKEESENAGN